MDERERLLKELGELKKSTQGELADLKREVEKAQAAVDKLDEPRRRLQEAAARFDGFAHSVSERAGALTRQIQAAAPACVKSAIERLRKRRDQRGCDAAISQLEKLALQPGDVSAEVRKILATLAESEIEDIIGDDVSSETDANCGELVAE